MVRDRGTADAFEVIDRGGESDRAGDIRRAGFETVRRFFIGAFLEGYADDHLAAAVPGRHCVQQLGAAVEGASSSGSAHFVAGEGEEIAAEFLDIDRHVARALGGIDQRGGADRTRFRAEFFHRIDRA